MELIDISIGISMFSTCLVRSDFLVISLEIAIFTRFTISTKTAISAKTAILVISMEIIEICYFGVKSHHAEAGAGWNY